jgi:hypothetical protein
MGPSVTWIHGKRFIRKSEVTRWIEAWTETPGKPYRGEEGNQNAKTT